jgi:hypothetical protein
LEFLFFLFENMALYAQALHWGIACSGLPAGDTTELRVRGKIGTKTVWTTVYFPKLFDSIRTAVGLTHEDFQSRLQDEWSGGKRAEASKSGSLFYRSKCDTLLVKSIHPEEMDCLLRISQDFSDHFQAHTTCTLSPILGAYRVRVNRALKKSSRFFIVLTNVLCPRQNSSALRIYDLKGTTENRLVNDEVMSKTRVGKDLNFTNEVIDSSHQLIWFGLI